MYRLVIYTGAIKRDPIEIDNATKRSLNPYHGRLYPHFLHFSEPNIHL